MERTLAMVALALAVLVLQTHAIQGWTMALTGQWPGWGWALLTAPADGWALALLPEVANLLAWWRAARTRGWARGGWSALAVLALALVVAAPLYTITAPALDSLAGAHAVRGADPVVDTLDATVRALAADWRTRPQAAELARELRAEAARAREDATRTAQPWRAQAVLAAELAVVLLAALVTAAASWFLAGSFRKGEPAPRPEYRPRPAPETRPAQQQAPGRTMPAPITPPAPAQPSEQEKANAEAVASIVRERKDAGETQGEIAASVNITERDLSLAVNHMDNCRRNGRRLSATSLARVRTMLEAHAKR